MDPFDFKLSNRPNLPFLNSAMVQISEELARDSSDSDLSQFSPFGVMEGYLSVDANAEMIKSLRMASHSIGILRFGHERAAGLTDLPRLTASAARSGARPTKAKPVTFTVTPIKTEITSAEGGATCIIDFNELQNVRVDSRGRFFFMVAGGTGAPPCLKATRWIVPALALLLAGAARRAALGELETEIERKVRSR